MAGLERADTRHGAVAGEDLNEARRGRARALPRPQHRHRLPVVPPDPDHDGAGKRRGAAGARRRRRRAARARATSLRPSASATGSHHYPAELSGGEQQRVAHRPRAGARPGILVADEPTGNLDEATGRQIIELLFAGHASAARRWCWSPTIRRSPRAASAWCGCAPAASTARSSAVSVAAAARRARAAGLLPLRFALREMRGGLRGFYVFIACIALGVDGDRRRRFARRQPCRRAGARGPRDSRRRLLSH